MTQTVLYVVSDAFRSFAANGGAITYGEALSALRGEGPDLPADAVLRPGQGLSEAQVAAIAAQARLARLDGRLSGFDAATRPLKADGRLTHKARPENVLISVPRQVDDALFECDLMLDADSELMRDHLTGQHIQGMVLIEACRQAFLAVTEAFFVAADDETHYAFVINEMNAAYKGFVFPVEATIRYRIEEQDLQPDRKSFAVVMEVVQAGEPLTEVRTRFMAFDAAALAPKEGRRAVRALEAACAEPLPMPSAASLAGAAAARGRSGRPRSPAAVA